mmetsp:Transcript_90376/g.292205  ORF Transcript_90376/g.292205 Transcript_90376/m.292205 type:complete len:139 (-) Transcript_90376:123-539(-)
MEHDELFSDILLRRQGNLKASASTAGVQRAPAAAPINPAATLAAAIAHRRAPAFPYTAAGGQGAAATYWVWFRGALAMRLCSGAAAAGANVQDVLREPTALGLIRICAEAFKRPLSEEEMSHLDKAPVSAAWLREVLA